MHKFKLVMFVLFLTLLFLACNGGASNLNGPSSGVDKKLGRDGTILSGEVEVFDGSSSSVEMSSSSMARVQFFQSNTIYGWNDLVFFGDELLLCPKEECNSDSDSGWVPSDQNTLKDLFIKRFQDSLLQVPLNDVSPTSSFEGSKGSLIYWKQNFWMAIDPQASDSAPKGFWVKVPLEKHIELQNEKVWPMEYPQNWSTLERETFQKQLFSYTMSHSALEEPFQFLNTIEKWELSLEGDWTKLLSLNLKEKEVVFTKDLVLKETTVAISNGLLSGEGQVSGRSIGIQSLASEVNLSNWTIKDTSLLFYSEKGELNFYEGALSATAVLRGISNQSKVMFSKIDLEDGAKINWCTDELNDMQWDDSELTLSKDTLWQESENWNWVNSMLKERSSAQGNELSCYEFEAKL